jgi:choline kinase
VKVRGGRVVDMSKTMDPAQADGENVGIVKFGARDAAALVAIMDGLVVQGRLRDWAPRAFAAFAQRCPLYAIGTRGLPWIEIDFPEDYRRALSEILPAIEADSRGSTSPIPVAASPGLS